MLFRWFNHKSRFRTRQIAGNSISWAGLLPPSGDRMPGKTLYFALCGREVKIGDSPDSGPVWSHQEGGVARLFFVFRIYLCVGLNSWNPLTIRPERAKRRPRWRCTERRVQIEPSSSSNRPAARSPIYWRVEGSLLELTTIRPIAFFTWNSQTYIARVVGAVWCF